MVAAQVVGTIAAGILLSKFGFYWPFYASGTLLVLIGSIFLHTSTINTSNARIIIAGTAVGLGIGLYGQIGYAVIQGRVSKKNLGQAMGFLTSAQMLGGVIALAIGGSILINDVTSGFSRLFPDSSEQTIKNAIAGTAATFFDDVAPETREIAFQIIVSAIDKVFILGIAAGAFGLVCSAFLIPQNRRQSDTR